MSNSALASWTTVCKLSYRPTVSLQDTRTSCSNLSTLSQLHWLPVHDRIKFKIATMTYKAIYTGYPHILQIWSSGTLYAKLYGLILPTFSVLLVVTSHLVLEVFARQLLLSGIVSHLTPVLAELL